MVVLKKFTSVIVLMLVLSSSHCLGSEATLSIHITDKNSSNKDEVISSLLSLQETWQIDIRKEQPEHLSKDGFLFVRMKPEFLRGLIDGNDAKIIWAESKGELAGYIILTEINEFFDLYVNSPVRTFACDANQSLYEEYLVSSDVKYIEQIAVSRGMARAGIGSLLMNEAKRMSPSGLVAAVLTQPVSNRASLYFFSNSGFGVMGHLNCVECAEWPAYQTRVYFWQP